MRVFVAGMSRSGSMWTYNATRELLKSVGLTPVPHSIPANTTPYINKAFTEPVDDNEIYCVKTHMKLQPDLPDTKIINTYRDVRSAMVSYMRFCRCGFGRGLKVAQSMMNCTDYYFKNHTQNIIHICYDRIMNEPSAVMDDICRFLGLSVDRPVIQKISDALSHNNIRNMTETLEIVPADTNGSLPEQYDKERFDIVQNLDGSFRVFDRSTGFQTNHITSQNEDDWKQVLTEEQMKLLTKITGQWLAEYGFAA